MSNEISNKLLASFGIEKLEYALFYNWKYSLRFELNSGGSYIEMFTAAYDRSRELLQYTFTDSDNLYSLIRFYSYTSANQKYPKEMRRLKRCDFKLPEDSLREKSTYICFEGEENELEEYHYEYLFPITINNSNYQSVLWAVCSKDIGIQPSAKIDCYFIDFKRKIIAHPYDDRGMDIIATKKESLICLYKDYYHWLLDYDLELMHNKFGIIR